MHRFTVSLAVVVVLVIGTIATLGRGTAAQEATPGAMADHAIVGLWQWENDFGDEVEISYATFHADGTYVEIGTDNSVDLGVWHPLDERTVALTFVFADLDRDPEVTVRGEGRQTITVDETGDTMSGPFTFVARDPDGTVLFSGEFSAVGTRLEVLPMVPLGTPVAATPAA